MYPTHLRGTGESFAANIGGRMIGRPRRWSPTQLTLLIPGGLAAAAGIVGIASFVLAFVASSWLPEPESEELLT